MSEAGGRLQDELKLALAGQESPPPQLPLTYEDSLEALFVHERAIHASFLDGHSPEEKELLLSVARMGNEIAYRGTILQEGTVQEALISTLRLPYIAGNLVAPIVGFDAAFSAAFGDDPLGQFPPMLFVDLLSALTVAHHVAVKEYWDEPVCNDCGNDLLEGRCLCGTYYPSCLLESHQLVVLDGEEGDDG